MNKFRKKYMTEKENEYFEIHRKKINQNYMELFQNNNIDLKKEYSPSEIEQLLQLPDIKKLNNLMGLVHFKNDNKKTGLEILNIFIEMRLLIKKSFFIVKGPSELVFCPECGKIEEYYQGLLFDDEHPCFDCRLKSKIPVDDMFLTRLWNIGTNDYYDFIKEESKLGIDYSKQLDGDDKAIEIINQYLKM